MAKATDHAIVRYLERVYGIDMALIRAEIETRAVDQATAFGCNTVIAGNGARLRVIEGRIITVLPKRNGRKPHITEDDE